MHRTLALSCLMVLTTAACSSSSSTGAGTTTDGGSSSFPPGATSPAQADNTCTPFYTTKDAKLKPQASTAAPPAATGGSITDGNYVLTDVTYYGTTAGTADATVVRLHFGGGFEVYTDGTEGPDAQIIGRSFTTAGTKISFSEVCHTPVSFYLAGNSYSVGYTATANTYAEQRASGAGVEVMTYTHE